jgi:hypothetical protein
VERPRPKPFVLVFPNHHADHGDHWKDWIEAPRGTLNKLAPEEDSSIQHKLQTIIFEKI